jgi:hypothetical protein
VRVCFMLARVRTPSSPIREREKKKIERGEGEIERVRKREGERELFIFKRNDGCLGTF